MDAQSLAELPTDVKINVSALIRDLEMARQDLATKRATAELQRNDAQSTMDDIDTFCGVILQAQVLLSQLVKTGLITLDFEADNA